MVCSFSSFSSLMSWRKGSLHFPQILPCRKRRCGEFWTGPGWKRKKRRRRRSEPRPEGEEASPGQWGDEWWGRTSIGLEPARWWIGWKKIINLENWELDGPPQQFDQSAKWFNGMRLNMIGDHRIPFLPSYPPPPPPPLISGGADHWGGGKEARRERGKRGMWSIGDDATKERKWTGRGRGGREMNNCGRTM